MSPRDPMRTWKDFSLVEKFLVFTLLVLAMLMLLTAIFCPRVFGGSGLWDHSIIFSDQATLTFAWDPAGSCPTGNTCGYDLELRQLETTFIDGYYKIQGTSLTASYKKSGHYELFVRAWYSPDMKNFTYTAWSGSSTAGQVIIGLPAPASKGWYLYWRLPAPSGGGIN